MQSGVTPALVRAWLEARSIVRELPAPVDDQGGYRVDTRSSREVARWVFPTINPGLVGLGQSLTEPRHFIKLCGTMHELCAVLPRRWRPHASGYLMTLAGVMPHFPVPDGHECDFEKIGQRAVARITRLGQTVALGHAAETEQVFIYDRIETHPLHRRKGLGKAVISLLRSARSKPAVPEVLVATEDGRKLYEALGWLTLSEYSTACIPRPT